MTIAYSYRTRLLPSAIEKLRRDPGDGTAHGSWRMANVLSLVLTMSVALYGFALRTIGGKPTRCRSHPLGTCHPGRLI
jgi:hypothetical protein